MAKRHWNKREKEVRAEALKVVEKIIGNNTLYVRMRATRNGKAIYAYFKLKDKFKSKLNKLKEARK